MNEEVEAIKKEIEDESKLKKIICSACGKLIKYKHKSRPNICPFCNDRFYNKAEEERKLFLLQEEYLQTKNKKTLGNMYIILKEYYKKLIVNMVKGKYFFDKNSLDIKAHDSACKVIEYYLEKPDFRILTSFGGYGKWPIRGTLYGNRKEDSHDSLNSMIDQDNELDEYLPHLSYSARQKMIVNFEENLVDNDNMIVEKILKFISEIKRKINKNFSKTDSLLFLIGLRNKINGMADNLMDDYFLFCGKEIEKHINDTLFLIYKLLKQNS